MSMESRNRIGTISEKLAQVWLLEQGYLVFENIQHFGAADLIAWNPETNEFIPIDVKTVRAHVKQDGTKTYYGPSESSKRRRDFVKYLGYCPEDQSFLWLD